MIPESAGAYLRCACEKDTVLTALKLAAVVGSLLVLINQWEAVTGQASLQWGKLVLTYMVPYGVSTYSSVKKDLFPGRGSGNKHHQNG